MHLADRSVLWSKMRKRGVFATSSPDRPNPIGISKVKVVKAEGNTLYVKHLAIIMSTIPTAPVSITSSNGNANSGVSFEPSNMPLLGPVTRFSK